jgi:4-diphosphocytidyl-2-C-methyl-D-erythritol kinase
MQLRVRALAKVNLMLRLIGRRPDGYHEVRTVLQSLALHDALTFTTTRGPLRIETDDPECPVDRANLVWGAAERLWRAAGRPGAPRGVTIRIEKRIPARAGLGGGSSDAAAAVRALAAVWRVKAGERELCAVAASLGADVPFFLEGGTVLGTGRGDLLWPLADAPKAWVVLVVPGFGVTTAAAYAWWDRRRGSRARQRASEAWYGAEGGNDLQAPVIQHHPEIGRMVRALGGFGARAAAMSGSGSAVFGLFTDRDRAEDAAAALAGPGRRAIVTWTVGRREYRRRTALEML